MNSKKQEFNWKLIGVSEHINYLKRKIEYVAQKIKTSDIVGLLSGESGTGKELIAKAIVEQSRKKLVPINCGAIPSELFESDFLGIKEGLFQKYGCR